MAEKNLFSVKSSPTCDLGCIANCFIPRHTVVLIEMPILFGEGIRKSFAYHRDGTHACQMDDDMFLALECGLDDETRDTLWELHDQFIPTYKIQEKRVYGIIKSNAFTNSAMVPYETVPQGLYPIGSRMNHSCSPNVGYDFVDGWNIRMYTVRDVQKGEELQITYTDLVYHPRDMRQAFMRERFLFDCNCPACCPKDAGQIRISDERRARLQELALQIAARRLGDETTSVQSCDLDMLMECMELLVAEGIDHSSLPLYKLAYNLAVRLEDWQRIEQLKEQSQALEQLVPLQSA